MNGLEYMNKICPTTSRGKDPNREDVADAFDDGVAEGYKQAEEGLWNKEKVIDWIEDNLYDYIFINRFAGNVADWNTDLIKDLRKAMEE